MAEASRVPLSMQGREQEKRLEHSKKVAKVESEGLCHEKKGSGCGGGREEEEQRSYGLACH